MLAMLLLHGQVTLTKHHIFSYGQFIKLYKYQNLDSWHIDFVRRMQALLSRLAIQTLNDNGNLKKFLTFICCSQKIKFILHIFPEILQRHCKFNVLGTLGMPGYANPK